MGNFSLGNKQNEEKEWVYEDRVFINEYPERKTPNGKKLHTVKVIISKEVKIGDQITINYWI